MNFVSYIVWNPKREIFTIPFLNFPILWYSVLFAIGFIVGYYLFFIFLKRYLLNFPFLDKADIKNFDLLLNDLKNPVNDDQRKISEEFKKQNIKIAGMNDTDKQVVVNGLNRLFFLDLFPLSLKVKGVKDEKSAAFRFFLDRLYLKSIHSVKNKALHVTDKITFYVIVATIIGARIGHILFYENIFFYLKHPLNIFKLWEGGLASHGAAVAIIIALILLCFRLKDFYPRLSFLTLLDLVSLPTAFAAVCIRLGNFFNQEILGKKTASIFGVLFLNPRDGTYPAIRHPAQLYEAFFYLIVFLVLLFLSYKPKIFLKEGKFIGLFLVLVFTFRFFIEFIKEEQSNLLSNGSILTMGQYLSIPFIILGLVLLFMNFKKRVFS